MALSFIVTEFLTCSNCNSLKIFKSIEPDDLNVIKYRNCIFLMCTECFQPQLFTVIEMRNHNNELRHYIMDINNNLVFPPLEGRYIHQSKDLPQLMFDLELDDTNYY